MDTLPLPRKKRRDTAEGSQAWLAAIGILGVTALALFSGGTESGAPPDANVQRMAEDEINTGSILFVPIQGDECRHRMFDNRDGRMWDAGAVSCELVFARNAGNRAKVWSAARVDAIRGGFQR